MKRPGRLCPLLLVGLLLAWLGPARAQPCLTCRTEKCPAKPGLKDWCGQGQDPSAARRRPRPTTSPKTETPSAPAPPPAAEAPAPESLPPARPAPPALTPPQGQPETRPAPEATTPRQPLQPAALSVQAGPSLRRGRLWRPGWVLLGIGLAAVAAGAALLAVDGRPTCNVEPGDTMCPEVLDTRLGGGLVLGGGAAALLSSAIMLGVSARVRGP